MADDQQIPPDVAKMIHDLHGRSVQLDSVEAWLGKVDKAAADRHTEVLDARTGLTLKGYLAIAGSIVALASASSGGIAAYMASWLQTDAEAAVYQEANDKKIEAMRIEFKDADKEHDGSSVAHDALPHKVTRLEKAADRE